MTREQVELARRRLRGLRIRIAMLGTFLLMGGAAVLHRAYHLSRMPTTNRKALILVDWIMAFVFRRDVVSLAQINNPKADFDRAAAS